MNRILVVEDSATFQGVIQKYLAPVSTNIFTAQNGIEGVRMAISHSPKVMTLDLDMPILGGASLLEILSMIGLYPSTIVVTGSSKKGKELTRFPNVVKVIAKNEIEQNLQAAVESARAELAHSGKKDFTYQIGGREFFQFMTPRDRKKVLIISENQDFIQEASQKLLGPKMYEVFSAKDSKEGLLKSLMLQPDLILCERDAKGLNGLQLAQTLFVLGQPFPLVLLLKEQDTAFENQARIIPGVRDFFIQEEVYKPGVQFLKFVAGRLKNAAEIKHTLEVLYNRIDIDALKASGGLQLGGEEL